MDSLPAGRRVALLEFLERRQMLSVSLDSNGWYNVAPSADTRVIYVSSSAGNDLNDGLSDSTPVQSINIAKNLIRDGSADWLLLKRGDSFTSGIGSWTRSGRSSDEPILIGAYGDGDRPLLNTNIDEGFFTDYGGHPIDNIAITGLHLVASGYTGANGGYQTTGIRLLRQGQNYLLQDLKIEGYKDNIVLQGDGTGLTNIEINRVISVDAYNTGSVGNGHAQGLYAWQYTNGLTVERSVFDHNGWKEGVAAQTVFNHDLYINTGAQNIIVRNNIISRGSNNGVLLRAGGTIQDNLFIRNSVGAIVDNTDSTITGNVVLESMPVPGTPQGVGFNIETDTDAYVANNIVAHDLNSGTSGISGISVNNTAAHVVVENNTVYDWRNGINNGGNRKITIRDNAAQAPTDTTKPIMQNRFAANPSTYTYSNNIYWSKKSKPFQINGVDQTLAGWITATKETNAQWQQLNYVDPNRSAGSYNATLGGEATTDAFLAAARNQAGTWDTNYSAAAVIQYIRAGFAAAAPTGQILGNIFNDAFGEGTRDASDLPQPDVTVYLDSNNDGQRQGNEPTTTSDSTGNYSFTNLADGIYHVRMIPPNGLVQSAPAAESIDITIAGGATYAGRDFGVTQPVLRAVANFDLQGAPLFTITFNRDVFSSLERDDLQVANTDDGAPIDMGLFTFDKGASGVPTVAKWSAGALPNGNYRMTLPAGSVTSTFGSLPSDLTFDCWVLAADGDRSRQVDILDFNILAANFGKIGQTFSQGNYNYSSDGLVDISDFNVLALNFGKKLDPPAGQQSVASSSSPPAANGSVTTPADEPLSDQGRVADAVLQ
jgi:hypothetical protein